MKREAIGKKSTGAGGRALEGAGNQHSHRQQHVAGLAAQVLDQWWWQQAAAAKEGEEEEEAKQLGYTTENAIPTIHDFSSNNCATPTLPYIYLAAAAAPCSSQSRSILKP
jgi:hypothetical protein